jgi:peptide chain release factor subunit 3
MERKPNSPFMMPIAEKSKDMGTFIGGKIESGTVKKGQSLLIMPNKKEVEVAALYYDETEIKSAACGDMIRLKLKGVEEEEISMGFVICDPIKPVNIVHTFIAQLVIQEHKNILCPGYTAILHVHTLVEEVTLKKFLFQVDTKTGEKLKPNPHYVKQGQSVLAVIECQGLICLETYVDHQQLGRFTLRDEGKTVAIGIVKKLILPTTSASVSAPSA